MKIWILRLIPFGLLFFLFLAAVELYARYFHYDSLLRDNPCIVNLPQVRGKPGLRRMFRASCHAEVRNYDGSHFQIDTNEDGLRDRPRSEFGDGAVALLGDSHVEGWALNAGDTLGRQLEAAAGGRLWGGRILNVGFRGLGPEDQMRLLAFAVDRYRLKGVIWVVTENDLLDEIYLRTRDPGNPVSRLLFAATYLSEHVFRRGYYSLEAVRMALFGLGLAQAARKLQDRAAAAATFCRVLQRLPGLLSPRTPVVLLAIPHGIPGSGTLYLGNQLPREPFWEAISCVASDPRIRVIDQRGFFSSAAPYLIPDNYHLNAQGTKKWAEQIIQSIRAGKP